ncbi:MAG TPA: hypothetical protein PLB46_11990, partial [Chitinophagales bacterium]|nr:hypothetical protein [Chitinophagales bacterium]
DHNQSLSNASVGSILTHLDVYKIELNTDRFWLADELYIDNTFNVISQYLEKAQNLLDSDILNWYDENDQNKLNEYKKYFNDIKTSNNENK